MANVIPESILFGSLQVSLDDSPKIKDRMTLQVTPMLIKVVKFDVDLHDEEDPKDPRLVLVEAHKDEQFPRTRNDQTRRTLYSTITENNEEDGEMLTDRPLLREQDQIVNPIIELP